MIRVMLPAHLRTLARLKGEGLNLFYLRVPVDFGFTNGPTAP